MPAKIYLRSSDLFLIISVWKLITYFATSNETSFLGGIHYLNLNENLLNFSS